MCRADKLIEQLTTTVGPFQQEYELLEEYFNGHPLDSLRPLLSSSDPTVRRSAIWIAAELGHRASILADDVVPLLTDDEEYVRYYAYEVIMTGADDTSFWRMLLALDDPSANVRSHAMGMLCNASTHQLRSAIDSIGPIDDVDSHLEGLKLLLTDTVDMERLRCLCSAGSPRMQMYAAIAVRRSYPATADILASLEHHKEEAIREFSSLQLELIHIAGQAYE
jgi:hypothetical protein